MTSISKRWRVTLANPHTGAAVVGRGRSRIKAFEAAKGLAGNAYLQDRGSTRALLMHDWEEGFTLAMAFMRGSAYASATTRTGVSVSIDDDIKATK